MTHCACPVSCRTPRRPPTQSCSDRCARRGSSCGPATRALRPWRRVRGTRSLLPAVLMWRWWWQHRCYDCCCYWALMSVAAVSPDQRRWYRRDPRRPGGQKRTMLLLLLMMLQLMWLSLGVLLTRRMTAQHCCLAGWAGVAGSLGQRTAYPPLDAAVQLSQL